MIQEKFWPDSSHLWCVAWSNFSLITKHGLARIVVNWLLLIIISIPAGQRGLIISCHTCLSYPSISYHICLLHPNVRFSLISTVGISPFNLIPIDSLSLKFRLDHEHPSSKLVACYLFTTLLIVKLRLMQYCLIYFA